jgi:isoquinoline 1-oxidoreductase beta subunit
VRAEHAPSNADLYKNFALGAQGTGGSTAMANSYAQMRKAGATARAMLVAAAAAAWRVPAGEITVERGVLRHASRREGRFGEFAEAAARLAVPADVPLKDPSAFRLIGREGAVRRLDSAIKANGSAQFTIDIREPGMLTVLVARPPAVRRQGGVIRRDRHPSRRRCRGRKANPLRGGGLRARFLARIQGTRSPSRDVG